MASGTALDLTAHLSLLSAVEVSFQTAGIGPTLQGFAWQVQAALLAVSTAQLTEDPAEEGGWVGLKGGDHLTIAGPDLIITAEVSAGQVRAAHLSAETRTVQFDFGDPATRVTSAGLLETAGQGVGALTDRLKEAAVGQAEGTLGRVRVRVSEGTTTIADWSFDPTEGPIDNQDLEAQVAKVEADLERDIAQAGAPGETPTTDPTELTTGVEARGGLTGAVGAAAAAAAMAATQRVVRRALEKRRQPDEPTAIHQPSVATEAAPLPAPEKAAQPTPRRAGGEPPQPHQCENCGEALEEGDLFCAACGTPLATPEPEPAAHCSACGNALDKEDRFCVRCGTPVGSETPVFAPTAAEPAAQEWCYVTAPVEIRSVTNTDQPGGWLQPGTWYLADEEANGWVLVTEPDSGLQGWAPAIGISYQQVESSQTLEATRPTAWSGTHTVPASGLSAWTEPDPNQPAVTNVGGGLPVEVVERRGDWALIRASNLWEGWVDGRQLIEQ